MPPPLTATIYRQVGEALFGADWLYPMRRLLDIPVPLAQEIARASADRASGDAMVLPEEWRPKLEAAIRAKGRELRDALNALS